MRYRFRDFTLDSAQRELRRADALVPLRPRVFQLLLHLIEHSSRAVSKAELLERIWAGRVVSDATLNSCIKELRKAVGDTGDLQRIVQTLHGHGFRFVAPLTAEDDAPATPALGAAAIAVLPFMDMSPARDQDYFCEGVAEELIDALTHVTGLRVASRSSSFQFRGHGVDLRDAGRRLNVGAIVQGSVRKAGEQLRITVQLIDVATGYHKWSQRFERTLGDVFAIQDEIAASVATTLRGAELSPSEQRGLRRRHTAAEPYEYFLRGRQRLHRIELEQGRSMFERAIELDADYAPAWAGLATAHTLLYEWCGARDEDLQRADQASRTALNLDCDLADAHAARGFALSLHRRYDEAQANFAAAAQINPNLFEAYYYNARTCFARGEIQRSAQLFGMAAEVRHEDFQSLIFMAQSLRMLGRNDEAQRANREGVRRAEHALTLNPLDARALALGALALHDEGATERAMEWSRRALDLYPDDLNALLNGACLRIRAGLHDEGLNLLERVFGRGWGKRDWIERDPDYDGVRDDPRFQTLLSKLK